MGIEATTCEKCGKYLPSGTAQCRACGTVQGSHWRSVTLTTAPHLEGFVVTETIEIISAECVLGIGALRDFFAQVSDAFGGRSEATQKELREARRICLEELRKEAQRVGANAVIAVDLDYSELSGGGKSMLFLVASGTAVRVVKKGGEAT